MQFSGTIDKPCDDKYRSVVFDCFEQSPPRPVEMQDIELESVHSGSLSVKNTYFENFQHTDLYFVSLATEISKELLHIQRAVQEAIDLELDENCLAASASKKCEQKLNFAKLTAEAHKQNCNEKEVQTTAAADNTEISFSLDFIAICSKLVSAGDVLTKTVHVLCFLSAILDLATRQCFLGIVSKVFFWQSLLNHFIFRTCSSIHSRTFDVSSCIDTLEVLLSQYESIYTAINESIALFHAGLFQQQIISKSRTKFMTHAKDVVSSQFHQLNKSRIEGLFPSILSSAALISETTGKQLRDISKELAGFHTNYASAKSKAARANAEIVLICKEVCDSLRDVEICRVEHCVFEQKVEAVDKEKLISLSAWVIELTQSLQMISQSLQNEIEVASQNQLLIKKSQAGTTGHHERTLISSFSPPTKTIHKLVEPEEVSIFFKLFRFVTRLFFEIEFDTNVHFMTVFLFQYLEVEKDS